MTTFIHPTRFCAGLLLAVVAASPAMAINLLVDPGFEANPLTTATNVLTNFPAYQGVWGVENSTLTGVDGGVTPAEGVRMLRMDDTGSYTQGMQVTDVTSYAALIDSGGATVNLSALFNAHQNVPAALAGVSMTFFTTSTYGSNIPPYPVVSMTLDGSASTWEPIALSSPMPVGTRWLLSQVFFNDASLRVNGAVYSGYVDAARLDVVPEPNTVLFLLSGLAGLFCHAWRKRP